MVIGIVSSPSAGLKPAAVAVSCYAERRIAGTGYAALVHLSPRGSGFLLRASDAARSGPSDVGADDRQPDRLDDGEHVNVAAQRPVDHVNDAKRRAFERRQVADLSQSCATETQSVGRRARAASRRR
jgi:hypothetical protein